MTHARPATASCSQCALRPLCLPARIHGPELEIMNTVMHRRTPLAAGEHLYWEGDGFEAIFAVKRGGMKSYTTDIDGHERIRGFHLPGDLFALDAIDPGCHPTSAQALTKTEVCVLPFAQLERAAAAVPGLLHRLFALMSRDLNVAQALAGEFSAEQRMAAFLLQLAEHGRRAGGPPGRLTLDMGRRDIGNYLRLVTETVSRVLTRFRDVGLIAADRREIRILDESRLRQLAGPLGLGRLAGKSALATAA